MERLTKWENDNAVLTEYDYEEMKDKFLDNVNDLADCVRLQQALDKLAEYEDAEEQGLLLRLPCRMGDTLYQPIYSNIYDYKVTGLCFDIVRNKWMLEVSYEINDEWYKTTGNFESIGKTVFLTKEEAEQALERMKAGAV